MTTYNPGSESGSSTGITVALQTVGCKLNQAESETLARRFANDGFSVVTPEENPDVYILNTCTVTHIADRKCRQYLRAFHRKNPRALIVVAGCYVERDIDGVQVEGVNLAVNNKNKDNLVEIVESRLASRGISCNGDGYHALPGSFRTRAMVKVQEGCAHACSYCIVPHVRGRERSMAIETILSEIESREQEGCKEIVLTGTRIGNWDGESGLEGLVRRILEETAIPRIRLSSLQPRELSPALVDLWKVSDRVCQHLHLALQSGCGTTLERMRREYSIGEYESAVNMVRDAIPDIAITTDIIVGFPGETEGEFEESYRFCERVGFANMHIFPYSSRTGTLAAKMPGKVPDKVKKSRSQRMLEMAKQSSAAFRHKFKGEVVPVLWEEQKSNNLWIGHTGNYIKVLTRSSHSLKNCLVPVKLGDEHQQGMWGEVLPSEVAFDG